MPLHLFRKIIDTFIKTSAPNMKYIALIFAVVFACTLPALAQRPKPSYFNMSSPADRSNHNYGMINIEAGNRTVVIGTIMAYGENVKGLTIRINNGFRFKLAPSQNGTTLNYVGSTLNIVLQPGDKANIAFIDAGKDTGERQLYAAGETIE